MQFFVGFSSFTTQQPFDPSLFVEFRKRLGLDTVNALNDKIIELKTYFDSSEKPTKHDNSTETPDNIPPSEPDNNQSPQNKGRLITDATACPQDIAYPTDWIYCRMPEKKLKS
ncbi:MAG: hypothetical protein IPO21_09785 [Bacteroidales bacterium]|nr:hypothetical protein [Bacteroidales bacterium]